MTDWKGVFVVLFVCGLLFAAVILLRLPETLPKERRIRSGLRGTLRTFRTLLGNAGFMGYALSQGFVMAGMFAYISGSSFVLQTIYGVSPQMYSLIFAVNGFGIILTGQIAGRMSARVGERKLLICGLLLSTSGGILLLITLLAGGSCCRS